MHLPYFPYQSISHSINDHGAPPAPSVRRFRNDNDSSAIMAFFMLAFDDAAQVEVPPFILKPFLIKLTTFLAETNRSAAKHLQFKKPNYWFSIMIVHLI